MAACPSKLITGGSPHSAATASNSRPMLLVRGALSARASAASRVVNSAGLNQSAGASAAARLAEDFIEQAQGRAPRLAHGPIAAGQGEGPQMGRADEARPLAHQRLAAPDRAVAAVAGAVPGQSQHRAVQAVLGHAGGHVGVMVLHAHQRHAPARGQLLGMPRRGIVGMQIAGDHLAASTCEEIDQVVDRPAKDLDAQHAVQVADVRAEHHLHRLRAEPQRHGVLQMPADGQRSSARQRASSIGSGA